MASSTSETSQNQRTSSPSLGPGDSSKAGSSSTTENSAKFLFRVDAGHSPKISPHTAVDRPSRSYRIPSSPPLQKPLPTPENDNASRNVELAADHQGSEFTEPRSNAEHLSSQQSRSPEKLDVPPQPESSGNTSSDLLWHALHAENIAEILEKRLYEVERREHLLNRRAAQLAMEERKFRLWAHEEKMLLRQQQREHAVRQEELNRRSADLRWLLLMEDNFQTDTGSDFGHHNAQAKSADSTNPLTVDANSEFFENFCESFEELFQEDSQGIRRLKNS
jgi:hypothetical protein